MNRQVDTGTWDDPWFADLDPDAKLLFLYMLTNRRSTASGVYEITRRAMAFETGLDLKRIDAALESISSRVQWWPELQLVWVRNFLRHQAVSPNLYKSAWSDMLEMPDEIREIVGSVYPILTREEPPPGSKEELETLLKPFPKGSQRVPEPSRKTSLDQTSLVKTSSLESGADAPTPPQKPNPKGTRLPADFTVTDEMREWAKSEGASDRLITFETDKFLDYWPAVPGQKGVKLDWERTWKNWMRKAIQDAPAGTLRVVNGASPFAGAGFDPLRSMPKDEHDAYLRELEESKRRTAEIERQLEEDRKRGLAS